jgi:hypothetical protein
LWWKLGRIFISVWWWGVNRRAVLGRSSWSGHAGRYVPVPSPYPQRFPINARMDGKELRHGSFRCRPVHRVLCLAACARNRQIPHERVDSRHTSVTLCIFAIPSQRPARQPGQDRYHAGPRSRSSRLGTNRWPHCRQMSWMITVLPCVGVEEGTGASCSSRTRPISIEDGGAKSANSPSGTFGTALVIAMRVFPGVPAWSGRADGGLMPHHRCHRGRMSPTGPDGGARLGTSVHP